MEIRQRRSTEVLSRVGLARSLELRAHDRLTKIGPSPGRFPHGVQWDWRLGPDLPVAMYDFASESVTRLQCSFHVAREGVARVFACEVQPSVVTVV
jgi:hypothetical protein